MKMIIWSRGSNERWRSPWWKNTFDVVQEADQQDTPYLSLFENKWKKRPYWKDDVEKRWRKRCQLRLLLPSSKNVAVNKKKGLFFGQTDDVPSYSSSKKTQYNNASFLRLYSYCCVTTEETTTSPWKKRKKNRNRRRSFVFLVRFVSSLISCMQHSRKRTEEHNTRPTRGGKTGAVSSSPRV